MRGFGYIGGNVGGALGALPIFTIEGVLISLFAVPAGVSAGGIAGGKFGAYFFDQTEGEIQSLMHK